MDPRVTVLSVTQGQVSESQLMECANLYCTIWKEPPWNEDFWKAEEVYNDIVNESQKVNAECFVAIFNDSETTEVVGFTWGYTAPAEYLQEISGSDYFIDHRNSLKNIFYVDELGVGTKFRGLGIGKHLSNALINNAKTSGAESLVLRTDEKAMAARNLYAKLGFIELPVRDAKYPGRTYWLYRV